MADVRPFRGIRYDTSIAGSLTSLICPPYDVISSQEREQLNRRNPYNMVELELPHSGSGKDKYDDAATLFRTWQDEGVLCRDQQPAFYLMRQSFINDRKQYERYGLMACVRLEEWEKGIILPHELTSKEPKKDRLALMEACAANLSPVMAFYRDPSGQMDNALRATRESVPDDQFHMDDGTSYAMWLVKDARTIHDIRQSLTNQSLYIADGHHRYETALAYRAKRQEGGSGSSSDACNFVLMTLISLDDPGLLILPYHRLAGKMDPSTFNHLWERIKELFSINPVPAEALSPANLVNLVQKQHNDSMTLGLLGPDDQGPYLITLHASAKLGSGQPLGQDILQKVQSWVIHEELLRPVLGQNLEPYTNYHHQAEEAWTEVANGSYQVAFFLQAFPLNLFEEVVSKKLRLPPKSTYFYPKLPSGLVINPLDGEM
jgi:uncharacterized protein (DUF1015 family)